MVTLPRSWLLALVLAAVVGLVAIGFLAGRGSSRPPAPVAAASTAAPPPPTPLASLEPMPYASPEATEATGAAASPAAPPRATATATADAPTPAPAPVDPAEREAVRRYFAQMDPYVEKVATAVNRDNVAQAVVAQAAQADPRGLRQILLTCQQAMQGIQSVRPPAPCQEHHRMVLEAVESAMSLVAQLGADTLTPMQETAPDNSAAAENLRREIQETRELRRELTRRYGL